jgi:hypothetical protein
MNLTNLDNIKHPYTELTLYEAIDLVYRNQQLTHTPLSITLIECRSYLSNLLNMYERFHFKEQAALDLFNASIDGIDLLTESTLIDKLPQFNKSTWKNTGLCGDEVSIGCLDSNNSAWICTVDEGKQRDANAALIRTSSELYYSLEDALNSIETLAKHTHLNWLNQPEQGGIDTKSIIKTLNKAKLKPDYL